MTDPVGEEMDRLGLTVGQYPRIVQEGDQIWIKVHAEGRDFICEVSLRKAFVLAIELMLALARLVPR